MTTDKQYVLGHNMIEEIGKRIGLPPHTTKFSIHFEVDDLVRVYCEYVVETNPDELAQFFDEYILCKRIERGEDETG